MACIVYEYLYGADGLPLDKRFVTAYTSIVRLPDGYGGPISVDDVIRGTYDSATGRVEWSLPELSFCRFVVEGFFAGPTLKQVPNQPTMRLYDLSRH